MSDIEGTKPQSFRRFAKKKLGFLAMEYSGHGKSSESLLVVILVPGLMMQKK